MTLGRQTLSFIEVCTDIPGVDDAADLQDCSQHSQLIQLLASKRVHFPFVFAPEHWPSMFGFSGRKLWSVWTALASAQMRSVRSFNWLPLCLGRRGNLNHGQVV